MCSAPQAAPNLRTALFKPTIRWSADNSDELRVLVLAEAKRILTESRLTDILRRAADGAATLGELRMPDLHALTLADKAARETAARFSADSWEWVAKQTHR